LRKEVEGKLQGFCQGGASLLVSVTPGTYFIFSTVCAG